MGKGQSGSIEKKGLASEKPVSLMGHDEFAINGRPGTLPVLEAFQEFLDAERERVRERMRILTAFVSLILLCVVGGSILVGSFFFRKIKENMETFRTESRTALTQLAVKTEKIRDEMEEEIRMEQETMLKTRSDIKKHANNYDNELEALKEVFSTLEHENKSLKKDISAMRSEWPALSRSVEALLSEIERLHALNPEYPVDTFMMPIIRPGKTRATMWRLPIPE